MLTEKNPTYMDNCDGPIYYYESILMNVSKEGYYEFIINRTMGTDVRIYNKYFDPLNLWTNLTFYFDEQCSVGEMKSIMHLKNDEIYDLVVSTLSPNIISSYSVLLIGPSHIHFSQFISNLIETKYSSEFTINSHECDFYRTIIPFDFYCECIKIDMTKEGYYTIRVNSSMSYIYGNIYGNNFTLFDLSINEKTIEVESKSNCNNHFKILLYSEMNTSMILIVKAEKQLEPSAFTIIVDGPSNVSMERISIYFHFVCFYFPIEMFNKQF